MFILTEGDSFGTTRSLVSIQPQHKKDKRNLRQQYAMMGLLFTGLFFSFFVLFVLQGFFNPFFA